MLLESITLKNIRSYSQASIDFTSGITLLAGDIGAGKSTILLSVEFALFGISRSELTGQALLRHGAQEGKVSLAFKANGAQYTITRTLKRSSSAISQDAGYLETDGTREALSPSELRAKVFSILGYPLQFLAKQKNLLYRFTMYTPQEEMKLILTQSAEERVETIRRLFEVDAYKQARDNAHLVAKALKDREAQSQSVIDRIRIEQERIDENLKKGPVIESTKKLMLQDRAQLQEKLKSAEEFSQKAEQLVSSLAQERQAIAMQIRELQLAKQELSQIMDAKRKKAAAYNDTLGVIGQLRMTIAPIAAELKEQEQNILSEEQIRQMQESLENMRKDEGKIIAILEQCKKHVMMQAGSVCPTCKQQVSKEHIDSLHQSLAAQELAAAKKHERMQRSMQELRSTMQSASLLQGKKRQLDEFESRLKYHLQKQAEDQEQLKLLGNLQQQKESRIKDLESKLQETSQIESKARLASQDALEQKQKLFMLRDQSLQLERRIAALDQELKSLGEKQEHSMLLKAELDAKALQKVSDQKNRDWLMHSFTPFASTIERHLLYTIHQQFDSAFRNWFSKLMEDESINARLDHDFSPVISQSGYETDTANLSGGERTSVSLAWRLALVHTIHALTPNLGTSGLIILDEPTDGFSSEQLERVRDVLREINMEQIIIVSHEQQLEGFVDHILRVRKTAQGSIVEQTA